MDNRTKNDKLQMATAFVLGANGAVGRELVAHLVAQKIFSKIVLIGRRKLELKPGHDEEDEVICKNTVSCSYLFSVLFFFQDQRVVEFDRISDYKEVFDGATVGFCALGTTRSAAGKVLDRV
jgi:oxidoreductase